MASKPQESLFNTIRMAYPDAEYDMRIFDHEVDIYIPSMKVAIEYDGSIYHAYREEKDTLKSMFLEGKGVRVLRVRESPLPLLVGVDCISVDKKDTPYKILFYLFANYGYTDNAIKSVSQALNPGNEPVVEVFNWSAHSTSGMFTKWIKEDSGLIGSISVDGLYARYKTVEAISLFSAHSGIRPHEIRRCLRMDNTFSIGVCYKLKGTCTKGIAIDIEKAFSRHGVQLG